MMTYTPLLAEPTAPEHLDAEALAAEVRLVRQDREHWGAERQRRATALTEREEEHRAVVANAQAVWGRPGLAVPDESPRVVAAREALAEAERTVAAAEARQTALLAEVRRRVEREEAAIAAERGAVEADERALAERRARLRELTAPLIEFEGYYQIRVNTNAF